MITLTSIPMKVRDGHWCQEFRMLRLRAGVRQREVAEAIGVSVGALSRWERGEPCMGAWRERQAVEWLVGRVREGA